MLHPPFSQSGLRSDYAECRYEAQQAGRILLPAILAWKRWPQSLATGTLSRWFPEVREGRNIQASRKLLQNVQRPLQRFS